MRVTSGGQVAAVAETSGPRRRASLMARAAALVRMEMSSDEVAGLLVGLSGIWLPIISMAMAIEAPSNIDPAAATVKSMIIGIIGNVVLYAKLFIDLNKERRANEEERRANEEERRANAEDRKKNEEYRKKNEEYRKKNEERWRVLMQYIEERGWPVPADLVEHGRPPVNKEDVGR